MELSFNTKQQMIGLSGACFWYWNSFYSFLESSGIPPAIYSRFPRDNKFQVMRSVLGVLDDRGDKESIDNLVSNFYRLRGAVDKGKLDDEKAKRLLAEFRESVGDDPIEAELEKRHRKQAKDSYLNLENTANEHRKSLGELNSRFLNLITDATLTPQIRGFQLETFFFDFLHYSEIENSKPYRTDDGEQIDGHFRYEKFDYLVELKWTAGPTKQKDLSIFDGKIRGKAQSTRGFFLSASGFDENAVNKFTGDSPRILLMTGEDLAIILSGRVTLNDAFKVKIDAIVRYGQIFFPLRRA